MLGQGFLGECGVGSAVEMTLMHLANCVALTFVPPWMIYKYKL
jgi:hypothetical protein